jgi:hypothetical protein
VDMRNRIVDLISEAGVGFKEKTNTIYTTCPLCQKDDKFSILKKSGSCICYRGSCTFGKRPFKEWVALTFNISEKDAVTKLFGERTEEKKDLNSQWTLRRPVVDEDETPVDFLLTSLKEMPWPEFHMYPLTQLPATQEGVNYLLGRGVPMETSAKYDIAYSKTYRRVYFPIKMSGKCYGYQGRHIDKVEDSLRVRNNEGFQRETLVMFADNLIGSDFAIIAEGPIDAIKFDLVGGNICTMGKVVTDKQLDIIKSYGIQKVYLALDDDALFEVNMLAEKFSLETFRLKVPESCVVRCKQNGKKADFGECSFEEARQAFETAIPFMKDTRILQRVSEGE